MGECFGYFNPDIHRRLVCRAGCLKGKYDLDFGDSPRYEWMRGPEGDLMSGIGPMLASVGALPFLQGLDPTLGAAAIEVTKPKRQPLKDHLEATYRLLRPGHEASLLPGSTTKGGRICLWCGRAEPIQILGVEKTRGEIVGGECRTVTLSARAPGAGMHVSRESLGSRAFFGWAGMIFCTAEARRAIEGYGLTNVAFRAYGELVGD